MAMLIVRGLSDEVLRSLQLMAAQHGCSTEAEVCEILTQAAQPDVRMGDALAAIGRRYGLTDEDCEAFDRARDEIRTT